MKALPPATGVLPVMLDRGVEGVDQMVEGPGFGVRDSGLGTRDEGRPFRVDTFVEAEASTSIRSCQLLAAGY
jgi:hypothetical protein